MKTKYTQTELDDILQHNAPRVGWDFSRMHTQRGPVPWNYLDEVKKYLRSEDEVLDIGTGGGEQFISLASFFRSGVGIDIDEGMVQVARQYAPKDFQRYISGHGLSACRITPAFQYRSEPARTVRPGDRQTAPLARRVLYHAASRREEYGEYQSSAWYTKQ